MIAGKHGNLTCEINKYNFTSSKAMYNCGLIKLWLRVFGGTINCDVDFQTQEVHYHHPHWTLKAIAQTNPREYSILGIVGWTLCPSLL